MRHVLIATHSTFASGIMGSLALLIGKHPEITTVDAYIDDSDYTKEVDAFFSAYNQEDEYLVFTDLFGGSVNQKLFTYKNKYAFFLITGFNLPILLETILYSGQLNASVIEELIERCRNELKLVDVKEEEDDEATFI